MNQAPSLPSSIAAAALLLAPTSTLFAQGRLATHLHDPGTTLSGSGAYGRHGAALLDLDGDGYCDYAVSAPSYPSSGPSLGRVSVYSGRTAQLLSTIDGSAPSSGFGLSLASIGDINSDGFGDLAIGSPDHDSNGLTNNGRVAGHSGANGTPLWSAEGSSSASALGRSMGSTIDFSGDGRPDVAVGEPGWDNFGMNRGRVVFIAGSSGAVVAFGEGLLAGQSIGEVIASRAESASVYSANTAGSIFLVSPPSGGPTTSVTLIQNAPSGAPGLPRIALVRSASGDRLVVGRTLGDAGGMTNNGTVELFAGGTTPLWMLSGPANNSVAGSSVAAIPDMSGDGEEEVGFQWHEGFLNNDSHVRIVTQTAALLEDQVSASAALSKLAGLPDVTGDGRGDWIRFTANDVANIGEAAIYSLGLRVASITPGANDWTVSYSLEMGAASAGLTYVQLYGGSGTAPGIWIPMPGWPLIPLNLDGVTDEAAGLTGSPVLPDALGVLDGSGTTTTMFAVPNAIAAALSGLSIYTVAAALDLGAGSMTGVTNPIEVLFP
ncbi:MAG: FG-GAP repeat protein [Planctomycetes bacterium]|nr:FG-GAP repeat protein [Planctomycetota bacterium]